MKNFFLVVLILTPLLSINQDKRGDIAIGPQFYQNILLADNYEGLGVGLNCQLGVKYGFEVKMHYFFESNDLLDAGNLKRFQGGAGINYVPFYKKKFSPWLMLGVAFNTLKVEPVSYLFIDNSEKKISQSYLTVNSGIGVQYCVNRNLILNTGLYFQPQNYSPNYLLVTNDEGNTLTTNIKSLDVVEPLLYFNFGFTYQIAELW